MIYPESLEKLINYYKKLPGIGEKNAERLALATLNFKEEDLDKFLDADDKEMLEDMIMIAIKDAFTKIDKETENKLGSYASMSGLF